MPENHTHTYQGLPATAVNLPIWRELFWPAEWLQLRISPLYQGSDIAKANGDPVILVPGFLASDTSLLEMHGWLERIGYDAYTSGFARNDDCPNIILTELLEKVKGVRSDSGRIVHLIGHSLGGTLARAAAVVHPELISQVITLGSPIHGLHIHPFVIALNRILQRARPSPDEAPRRHGDHYHGGSCSFDLAGAMSQPFPAQIPRASIFSRSDGLVDWRSSQDDEPGVNIEVRGTHLGLVVNREVYREVARLLASVDVGGRDVQDRGRVPAETAQTAKR